MTAVVLALVGAAAGLLGSLMGVGGGIIVVPALSELHGVPFREAIAVSLVVIIANSSASSAAYVERGASDLEVGVVLELATVAGAILGSAVAGLAPVRTLKLLFAGVAIYSAVSLWLRRHRASDAQVVGGYAVRGWAPGLAVSVAAGAMSGLLGIGGGVFKMPAMTLAMGLPFKVAAATSNFMIGVTAAAGAYVYWGRGEVNAELAAPVVVGAFVGARLGSSLLARLPATRLQTAFAVFLAIMGGRMAWSVLGGAG
ncbi:MAG TPA: sulfite exporter TauE/SafE family protein [Anaeromyxobacter sp.]|nr:sulfite exporter TauE/SafE family protein [Anaeromyxobacter sp.]